MCLTPSYIFRHGLHVAHSFRSHGVFSHTRVVLFFFIVPICGKTNSSVGRGSIAEDVEGSTTASEAGTSITETSACRARSSGSGTGDRGGRGGGGPRSDSDPLGPSPGGSSTGGSAFASAAIK